jgi:hypothetical protein
MPSGELSPKALPGKREDCGESRVDILSPALAKR